MSTKIVTDISKIISTTWFRWKLQKHQFCCYGRVLCNRLCDFHKCANHRKSTLMKTTIYQWINSDVLGTNHRECRFTDKWHVNIWNSWVINFLYTNLNDRYTRNLMWIVHDAKLRDEHHAFQSEFMFFARWSNSG